MADVVLYGAPAGVLSQGVLPAGWEAVRVARPAGPPDPAGWIASAMATFAASYSLETDVLRAVIQRYTAAPTDLADWLAARDGFVGATGAAAVRLVIAAAPGQVASIQATVDANPHPIRTYVISHEDMAAWVTAGVTGGSDHDWPTPLSPALGGSAQRIGGGRHASWSLCVTDPAARQTTPLEPPHPWEA